MNSRASIKCADQRTDDRQICKGFDYGCDMFESVNKKTLFLPLFQNVQLSDLQVKESKNINFHARTL